MIQNTEIRSIQYGTVWIGTSFIQLNEVGTLETSIGIVVIRRWDMKYPNFHDKGTTFSVIKDGTYYLYRSKKCMKRDGASSAAGRWAKQIEEGKIP